MGANFSFEKRLWEKGLNTVAGMDEVGRGSFAGPVMAGCVVFRKGIKFPEGIIVDDSKKLTSRKREKAAVWIKKNSVWGIGLSSPVLINRRGLVKATNIAFRKAIGEVQKKLGRVDFLLIDAFFVPYVQGIKRKNQMAIINGDEKSVSIAAASIIAKVERDSLMQKLGRISKYKKYKWIENKGYGTKDHQNAIKKWGITRYHRKLFVKNFL